MSKTIPVTIGLHFGALSDPIAEQLSKAEYRFREPSKGRAHQEDADAITRLAVRGLLTGADTERARKRLLKAILKDVEPKS